MADLTTQQIGKYGELLVQYQLLKHGIESAPMTTDTGIDLVAFPDVRALPEGRSKPVTIQVKTTSYEDPGPVAEEGVVWTVPWPCSADYIALVDKQRDKLWLFSTSDFERKSTKAGSARPLDWYVNREPPRAASRKESAFDEYEGEVAISRLPTLT
jgi:hypothetical protein